VSWRNPAPLVAVRAAAAAESDLVVLTYYTTVQGAGRWPRSRPAGRRRAHVVVICANACRTRHAPATDATAC